MKEYKIIVTVSVSDNDATASVACTIPDQMLVRDALYGADTLRETLHNSASAVLLREGYDLEKPASYNKRLNRMLTEEFANPNGLVGVAPKPIAEA